MPTLLCVSVCVFACTHACVCERERGERAREREEETVCKALILITGSFYSKGCVLFINAGRKYVGAQEMQLKCTMAYRLRQWA